MGVGSALAVMLAGMYCSAHRRLTPAPALIPLPPNNTLNFKNPEPLSRDTECGADTALAVHPGLINTSLARGWLVSTALPLPPVIRPLLAPVVRRACVISLFHDPTRHGHL